MLSRVFLKPVPNLFERQLEHKRGWPEVIRIGKQRARILSITHECIEYLDRAGDEQFVDLEQCARNWMRWFQDHREQFITLPYHPFLIDENDRTVALRGKQWAEFMNDRKTRFEFESWEASCIKLLGPLLRAGWRTFDTD